MTSEARLIVSDVSHAYGDFIAAQHVTLHVRAGEVHCLLGPSGSGKSTLLRLVAGLEHLKHGHIHIAGTRVAGEHVHVRPEDRSVGFVFQDYALFPHLNVLNNVLFGMPKMPKGEQQAAAQRLLEQVGMEDYATAMPHTLSGGQQQRVALARALAPEPGIMLLDEPFSGLDVRLREEVRNATLGILRAAGVATLMVTHDPREALNTADTISIIRHGRIVQTATPDEVYRRSANRRVAEIFGPINELSANVEGSEIHTILGPLKAQDLKDGTPVEVLIRPEALLLERRPEPGYVAGKIGSIHTEGGTMWVQLAIGETELRALDLARASWQQGDDVFVGLEPGAAMVHSRARSDSSRIPYR